MSENPYYKNNPESNYYWEKQQQSIPFLESLPDKYKVHDELLVCPSCTGELFGRCTCCQCYFCHGDCDVYTEEEISELCNGIDHNNDIPVVFKIKEDGTVEKQ